METLTVQDFQKAFLKVVNMAKQHPVEVRDDDGTVFVFHAKSSEPTDESSPFDIKGVQLQTPIDLDDVLLAVNEGRSRSK